MGAVEKEDLDELIKVLKQAVKEAEHLVDSTGGDDRVERCRENVRNFRTTASMLGIPLLEQVGLALEDYIARELAPANALGMAEVFPFAHAASALVDELRRAGAGDGELAFDAYEIIGILAVTSGQDSGGEITELSADEFPAGFLKNSDQLVQAESVVQSAVVPVEDASEPVVVTFPLDSAEESLPVEPVRRFLEAEQDNRKPWR